LAYKGILPGLDLVILTIIKVIIFIDTQKRKSVDVEKI
jgi:hypothetical protein